MVITFHSTTEAVAEEAFCKEEGIPGRLVPVPRQISAGCGLCWRMTPKDYEEYKDRLFVSGNDYDRIEEVEFIV